MDEMLDKGLVSDVWTAQVIWGHRRRGRSGSGMWNWIKMTLGQPRDISSGQWRGHLGLRRGSGQGELSAQRKSL